jgi:hypothetical protein
MRDVLMSKILLSFAAAAFAPLAACGEASEPQGDAQQPQGARTLTQLNDTEIRSLIVGRRIILNPGLAHGSFGGELMFDNGRASIELDRASTDAEYNIAEGVWCLSMRKTTSCRRIYKNAAGGHFVEFVDHPGEFIAMQVESIRAGR